TQTEMGRLHATNQQLLAALAAARTNLAQLQGQLEELQLASQQAQAESPPPQPETPPPAAAPPLSADAARKACYGNLRLIDEAKQLWALEHNKTDKDVPTASDLAPYFPNGAFPVCPSGGAYRINAVGTPPTCSIHGSVSR
ncbi:MAG: hypothetical protein KGR98_12930, partial [Verrucomicrobia bacterium]|nr:hypothetical protein [Verrucomicrobiota bacterium]